MIEYNPILNKIYYKNVQINILRLDLIHPEIQGNKWFKLKYNLQQAVLDKKDTIITFGGAYSNHIAATAFACKESNLKSVGIIRGDETSKNNATLSLAVKNGMELRFITRDEYRLKTESIYLDDLQKKNPSSYIIPEGGDNELGRKGCEEILTKETIVFNKIFCAYGTGTTFNGISNSINRNQILYGVNVLKYNAISEKQNTEILNDYNFGGYTKHAPILLTFKTEFENEFLIPLDYVYTSKLVFAVFDLIDKNKITEVDTILIVHSGGLQGNKGYEERYNLSPMRQFNDIVG